MSKWKVVREYEVEIPDDPREYAKAIEWLYERDPELSTGNYGDPDAAWLLENLLDALTREADVGTESVAYGDASVIADMGAGEVSTKYEKIEEVK